MSIASTLDDKDAFGHFLILFFILKLVLTVFSSLSIVLSSFSIVLSSPSIVLSMKIINVSEKK